MAASSGLGTSGTRRAIMKWILIGPLRPAPSRMMRRQPGSATTPTVVPRPNGPSVGNFHTSPVSYVPKSALSPIAAGSAIAFGSTARAAGARQPRDDELDERRALARDHAAQPRGRADPAGHPGAGALGVLLDEVEARVQ